MSFRRGTAFELHVFQQSWKNADLGKTSCPLPPPPFPGTYQTTIFQRFPVHFHWIEFDPATPARALHLHARLSKPPLLGRGLCFFHPDETAEQPCMILPILERAHRFGDITSESGLSFAFASPLPSRRWAGLHPSAYFRASSPIRGGKTAQAMIQVLYVGIPEFSFWNYSTFVCGSKNRYQNGTLVSENMDPNLQNPSCLILSHSHLAECMWRRSSSGACFPGSEGKKKPVVGSRALCLAKAYLPNRLRLRQKKLHSLGPCTWICSTDLAQWIPGKPTCRQPAMFPLFFFGSLV